MTSSDRKQKLPLIVAASVFLISALASFMSGNFTFAFLNLAMALLNFVALRFIERMPERTNALIHLANAVLAFFTAYDFFRAGKKGLPYAWLIAGLVFTIAFIIFLRKQPQITN